MAGRSRHNPPHPAHAPFVTGIAAPGRYDTAVHHSRPTKGRRRFMAHVTSHGCQEMIRRLSHDAD